MDRGYSRLNKNLEIVQAGLDTKIIIVRPCRAIFLVQSAHGCERIAAVVGQCTRNRIHFNGAAFATFRHECFAISMPWMKTEAIDDVTPLSLDTTVGIN